MKIGALIAGGRLTGPADCDAVKCYTIEQGTLLAMERLPRPAEGELPEFLRRQGVGVLLAGELTEEERRACGRAGLTLFTAAGPADEALLDLLERQLIPGAEACPAGGCAGCHGGCG
ncbi:MAG: hypothetical protein IK116_06195 [Firmicutes bacterium]|nr:hypothetical protein [Bacillota bacterium]